MTNSNSARTDSSALFYIRITASLLIIASLIAVMLAAVNSLTEDRIAENKMIEVTASISALFGEGIETEELTVPGGSIVTGRYKIFANGGLAGYCVRVAPTGFDGKIDMMVAITPEGAVKGVRVISHTETPGLGSKAAEDDYLNTYRGKSGTLVLGEDVDAIAGSTFSSRAIFEGVNAALSCYDGGEA